MWLSITADSRSFADVIAWMSPVKCKFISGREEKCRETASGVFIQKITWQKKTAVF